MADRGEPWPSVLAVAEAVQSGRSSAREEAERALDRIGRLNGALNALVLVDAQDVRARADAVDRRIRSGEVLPLAGVPLAVKDNIWIAGRRVTQGSHLFKDFVAPADAIAVERLVAAGAVVAGLANTAEFAAMGQTKNRLHGATRNPLNPALTPGGSSGGSVAAVAGGLVPLALGTDSGGSSRRPAAHTGLVGFKPSFGAVPYGPGFPEPFFGISCICPIARTVAEAALAFEAMVGPDPRDPHSAAIEPCRAVDLGLVRIGHTLKWGLDVPVDPEVAAIVAQAVEKLKAAGMDVVEADPQWPAGAGEAGLNAIQHAGLAALHGEAWRRIPELIDPDIGTQIEAGFGYGGTDVAAALILSEEIAQSAARHFQRHRIDVAIGPTTPCAAWPVDLLAPEAIAGVPVGPRGHAVFTPLFNHARQPAISIPCGTDGRGLPVGLQIVAPRWCDHRLLGVASAVEAVLAMDLG